MIQEIEFGPSDPRWMTMRFLVDDAMKTVTANFAVQYHTAENK